MRPNPDNLAELIFSGPETALTGITTLPLHCVEFACAMLEKRIMKADELAGSSAHPESMKHAYRAQSLRAINRRLLDEYLPKPPDDEYAFLLGGGTAA